MLVHYPGMIRESIQELAETESRLRGLPACDRIRMLRLLKSGQCRNQGETSLVLGYSARQLRRWWKVYQEEGLDALIHLQNRGGSEERVNEIALRALQSEIDLGRICLLKEVKHYLHDEHGITYHSLQGVHDMLRRQGIRLK